jgi:hypothetical protein
MRHKKRLIYGPFLQRPLTEKQAAAKQIYAQQK